MKTEIVLKIKNLTKKYNNLTAIDNLNIEILKGEIFGLIGPNGAGKSTTIECILGTKKFNSGSINLLGTDSKKYTKSLFENVGVQFQTSYFPERIKINELFELTASLYKEKSIWESLLKKFSMDSKRNSFLSELSGGEVQKVSVALALSHKPQIAFLDELTTGLDPNARREMWNFLKELNQDGLTIILTSHYMDEVVKLCSRILILKNGTTVISGTPSKVISESGKNDLEDAYIHFTGLKEVI